MKNSFWWLLIPGVGFTLDHGVPWPFLHETDVDIVTVLQGKSDVRQFWGESTASSLDSYGSYACYTESCPSTPYLQHHREITMTHWLLKKILLFWFLDDSAMKVEHVKLDNLRIIISPSYGPKRPGQKCFQWAKFETVNVEFPTLSGRGYGASVD